MGEFAAPFNDHLIKKRKIASHFVPFCDFTATWSSSLTFGVGSGVGNLLKGVQKGTQDGDGRPAQRRRDLVKMDEEEMVVCDRSMPARPLYPSFLIVNVQFLEVKFVSQ